MNALQKRDLSPFTPLYSVLFENNFPDSKFSTNQPPVNIKENDNEFKVEVAAPGLKKEDFKIITQDGLITIKVKLENENNGKDKDYIMKEFDYKSFSRSITLPRNVIDGDIVSKYEDGILRVNLHKKAVTNKTARE